MESLDLKLEDDEPWIIEEHAFNIIKEFLLSESTIAAMAASKINDLVPQHRPGPSKDKEGLNSFLWEIWDLFIRIAEQLPQSNLAVQEKFINLLEALTELPPTTVTIWSREMKLWTDLPILGPSLAEKWESVNPSLLAQGTKEHAIARQRWLNLNAVAARLTAHELVDLSLYSLWALRGALEQETVSEGDPSDTTKTAGQAWRIQVASEWIWRCGKTIYRLRKNLGSAGEGGPLWKGSSGFSEERWQFWKHRLGELSSAAHLDEESRSLATQIRNEMASIEADC